MFRSDSFLEINTEEIPWPGDSEPESGEITDEDDMVLLQKEANKTPYKVPVCRYYHRFGFCRKGDVCPLVHEKINTSRVWKDNMSVNVNNLTKKAVNVNDCSSTKNPVNVNDCRFVNNPVNVNDCRSVKNPVNVNDCRSVKNPVNVNDCCLSVMKENNLLRAKIDNLELELKTLRSKVNLQTSTSLQTSTGKVLDKAFDMNTFKKDITNLKSATNNVPEPESKRIIQSLIVSGNKKYGGRITTDIDEERRLALRKEGKRRRNREYKQRKALKNFLQVHDNNRRIGRLTF